MFNRNRSFSVLYGIQRTLLAVFYLASVLSLFWIIFYLLDDVLGLQGVTKINNFPLIIFDKSIRDINKPTTIYSYIRSIWIQISIRS